MSKCPSCSQRLRFSWVMRLSNTKVLTCPECGSQIKANAVKNSTIGGVGAVSAFGIYKSIPEPINYVVVSVFLVVLSVFYYYWVSLENENT